MKKSTEILRKDFIYWVMILSISSILAIVFGKDVLQRFTPRSIIFQDPTLTFLHSLTCLILFVCFLTTGICNFFFYRQAAKNKLPYRGYYWLYSMRSIITSFVFATEFVCVYIAFYWIDTIIRIISCWFSIALVIVLIYYIKELARPAPIEEFNRLVNEMEQLKKDKAAIEEELKNIKNA